MNVDDNIRVVFNGDVMAVSYTHLNVYKRQIKLYEKIFACLQEVHVIQTELSRRTGIATSTISDWRKKQINPQADKLVSRCV